MEGGQTAQRRLPPETRVTKGLYAKILCKLWCFVGCTGDVYSERPVLREQFHEPWDGPRRLGVPAVSCMIVDM